MNHARSLAVASSAPSAIDVDGVAQPAPGRQFARREIARLLDKRRAAALLLDPLRLLDDFRRPPQLDGKRLH